MFPLSFPLDTQAMKPHVSSSEYTKKTAIDLATTFGEAYVKGKVTDIDYNARLVSVNGERNVAFSHLVVATGSAGPFPCRPAAEVTTARELEAQYQKVSEEVSTR